MKPFPFPLLVLAAPPLRRPVACSSQRRQATGQQRQQQAGLRLPDLADRERGRRDAVTSFERLQAESAASRVAGR